MKRKRAPAPHGKKTRLKLKAKAAPEQIDSSDEEGRDIDNDEESFKGISDDDNREENDMGQTPEPEESQNNISGNLKKDHKRGKKPAPTKEELMELLFQSSSFQSNLFKLQVDELLSEVRLKYEKMEKIERILHKVKDTLINLPETSEQLVHLSFLTTLLIIVTYIRGGNEEQVSYSCTVSYAWTSERWIVQV